MPNDEKFDVQHEPEESFEMWTRKEIEFIRDHLAPLYKSTRKAERNFILLVIVLVAHTILTQASFNKIIDLAPLVKLLLGLP